MTTMSLFRGGFRSINNIIRPYSSIQSSFNGRTGIFLRKNLLFPSQQNQIAQQTGVTNHQIIRAVTSVHPHRSPLVRDDHAGQHWTIERYVAIGLLALIPGSIVLENPITDYLLAAGLVLHANWGCHSIIIDYVHGKTLPKVVLGLMYTASVVAFIGLCYFNYSDIGLSKAIKKVWSL